MITPMQQRFALEYLADEKRNATQAAIRAGYSMRSARFWASKMLKDPEVRRLIDEQLAARVQRLEVNGDFVVMGILKTIADARLAGQVAWQAQAILRGYELPGKSLGLFVDRVETNLDEKVMEALVRGRRRAAGLPEDEEEEGPEREEKPAEEQKPN
jgi:phage terminase small subunit